VCVCVCVCVCLLAQRESNNLLTDWQYFGVCYTVHAYFVCTEGGVVHMALFRRAIEGNEADLVRRIEVESGLWTHLLSRKVLTEEQLKLCRSEVF